MGLGAITTGVISYEVALAGVAQLGAGYAAMPCSSAAIEVMSAVEAYPADVDDQSRENIGRALVDSVYSGEVDPAFREYSKIVDFLENNNGSLKVRYLASEADALSSYLEGNPKGFANRQNLAHIKQLKVNGEFYGGRRFLNLSDHELDKLRHAVAISDYGKNFHVVEGVGSRLAELFPFHEVKVRSDLNGDVIAESWPQLAALVEYLRYAEIALGYPLQVAYPEEGSGTAMLSLLYHEWWGETPFVMSRIGEPPTDEDLKRAFSFARIFLNPEAPYFPTKFYWHEVIGFVEGYLAGVPRDVLLAAAFHNGPDFGMVTDELGVMDSYRDAPPNPAWGATTFWGSQNFRQVGGHYPDPLDHVRFGEYARTHYKGEVDLGERHKIGISPNQSRIAHLARMLDRESQGRAQVMDGKLVGGPIKIMVDELWQPFGKRTPLAAFQQAFEEVPERAIEQLHAVMHQLKDNSYSERFFYIYREMLQRIRETQALWYKVDVEASELLSPDGYAIAFRDGTKFVFEPPAKMGVNYSLEEAGELVEGLSVYLARYL